ncbi:hypothetical protein ACVK1V_001660 [Bacillus subtilis]|jgi:hypothetical protein|nr:hypothetical protein ANABIO4_35850 [Bacillus subtilis]
MAVDRRTEICYSRIETTRLHLEQLSIMLEEVLCKHMSEQFIWSGIILF